MAPRRVRRQAPERPSERTPWDIQAISQLLCESGMKQSHSGLLLRTLAASFVEQAGPRLWSPETLSSPGSPAQCGWLDLALTEESLTGAGLPRRVAAAALTAASPLGLRPVGRSDSADGTTTKLALELRDGHKVETVVMRHESRTTVCVSSQVGCQMGCAFCATGTMPIVGDLDAVEIVEQLLHAHALEVAAGRPPIRSAVFMGMGEPLNNYTAVKQALSTMVDTQFLGKYALPRSGVTVSTVGVVPKMLQLAKDLPHVSLALSLHAPTQELRERIVPAAKHHLLPELLEALDVHASNCRAMVEYVLLAGVNDDEACALELGRLMAPRAKSVVVNLIPYNPGATSADPFVRPAHVVVERFKQILAASGVTVRVRREMGRDISGACGQLALTTPGSNAVAHDRPGATDVEDFVAWRRQQPRSATAALHTECLEVVKRDGSCTSRGDGSREEMAAWLSQCWVRVPLISDLGLGATLATTAALLGLAIFANALLRYRGRDALPTLRC